MTALLGRETGPNKSGTNEMTLSILGNINSDLKEHFIKTSLCSCRTRGVSQWASTMSHRRWARCPNGAKNSPRNTCWLGALATVISHLSYVSLLAPLPAAIIKKIHFDPTKRPSSLRVKPLRPPRSSASRRRLRPTRLKPLARFHTLTLFQTTGGNTTLEMEARTSSHVNRLTSSGPSRYHSPLLR